MWQERNRLVLPGFPFACLGLGGGLLSSGRKREEGEGALENSHGGPGCVTESLLVSFGLEPKKVIYSKLAQVPSQA